MQVTVIVDTSKFGNGNPIVCVLDRRRDMKQINYLAAKPNYVATTCYIGDIDAVLLKQFLDETP